MGVFSKFLLSLLTINYHFLVFRAGNGKKKQCPAFSDLIINI
jgi:hypothetical protein